MVDKKNLINCFHPDLPVSRGNKIMLDAVRDLHAKYPDGVIDSEIWQKPFTVSSVIPEDAPWAQPISAENLNRRAAEYRELLASF